MKKGALYQVVDRRVRSTAANFAGRCIWTDGEFAMLTIIACAECPAIEGTERTVTLKHCTFLEVAETAEVTA